MCGIFGVYGNKEAVDLTYLGLYALQHRGEESAGIVASDKNQLKGVVDMGIVSEVFDRDSLQKLQGEISIGHVRYSTTGSSVIKNAQPFVAEFSNASIAIAHNGNFVNSANLRTKLEEEGSIFQSTMDSELILHLIARSKKADFKEKIFDAFSQVRGAHSILILTKNQLIAARDVNGFRPLCLGRLGDTYLVSSETCAFDLIKAKYIRDIEPGEVLVIDDKGLNSYKPSESEKKSFCIFEFIYFARPDSNIFEGNVYFTRKELGRQLAKEWPVDADIVLAVPDSGNYAALGFAEESGIKLEMGIIRNHYVGRTFIQPLQKIRDLGVKVKLNPVQEVIKGKKIVIIEDSIVRGTTSRIRIKTLREAGAKEVHMRVSCPPLISPCFYGIDFPTKDELIASHNSVSDITKLLDLNSLGYLSLEGMLKAMPIKGEKFCTACFTGEYPVEVDKNVNKRCCGE
ncbi:MAG: amidophosphoribosyltransferase [bacterium]